MGGPYRRQRAANRAEIQVGAEDGIRTRDVKLGKLAFYP